MAKQKRPTQKKQYTVFKDQVEDLGYYTRIEAYKQCRDITVDESVRVAIDEYIDKLKLKGI